MEILERSAIIIFGIIFLVIFSFFIYNSYIENNPLLPKNNEMFKIEKLEVCEQFKSKLSNIRKDKNIYYIEDKIGLKTTLEIILRKYPPCLDCNNDEKIFFKLDRDSLILSWNKETLLGEKKGDYCVVFIKDDEFNKYFDLELALIPNNNLNIKDSLILSDNKLNELKEKLKSDFKEDLVNKIIEGKLLIKINSGNKLREVVFDGKTYFIQPSLIFLLSNKFDLLLEKSNIKNLIKNVGFIIYVKLTDNQCAYIKSSEDINLMLKRFSYFYLIPNYFIQEDLLLEGLFNSLNNFPRNFYIGIGKDIFSKEICIKEVTSGVVIGDNKYLTFNPLHLSKYDLNNKRLSIGFFSEDNEINFEITHLDKTIAFFQTVIEEKFENKKNLNVIITFLSKGTILPNLELKEINFNDFRIISQKVGSNVNLNPNTNLLELIHKYNKIKVIINSDKDNYYLPSFYLKDKKEWNFIVFYLKLEDLKKLAKEGKLVIKKDNKVLKNYEILEKEEKVSEIKEIKVKKLEVNNGKIEIEII